MLASQREECVALQGNTASLSQAALTSVCSGYCRLLNVFVGVQFHWIVFFFFFPIVFVPMIENGSWSVAFEEVSFLICVCL